MWTANHFLFISLPSTIPVSLELFLAIYNFKYAYLLQPKLSQATFFRPPNKSNALDSSYMAHKRVQKLLNGFFFGKKRYKWQSCK